MLDSAVNFRRWLLVPKGTSSGAPHPEDLIRSYFNFGICRVPVKIDGPLLSLSLSLSLGLALFFPSTVLI